MYSDSRSAFHFRLTQRGRWLVEDDHPPPAMGLFRWRWFRQCPIAVDRPPADTNGPGIVRHIGAGLRQALNRLIQFDQPRMALPAGLDLFLEPQAGPVGHDGARGAVGYFQRRRRWLRVGIQRLGGRTQRGPALEQARFDHFTEVLEQMLTVGDLRRLRRAGGRCLNGGITSFAGDDLDARMLAQSGDDRLDRTIRSHLGNPMTLEINDDRAVAVAFAPGPVVNADDAWCRRHREFGSTDPGQERIGADR